MSDADITSMIKARKILLLKEIQARKSELIQIRNAEKALRADPVTIPTETHNEDKHTFKDMIMGVLKELPEGATANQILSLISRKYGINIARSSISPQLSRLRQGEFLVMDQKVWKMTEKKDQYPNFKKL